VRFALSSFVQQSRYQLLEERNSKNWVVYERARTRERTRRGKKTGWKKKEKQTARDDCTNEESWRYHAVIWLFIAKSRTPSSSSCIILASRAPAWPPSVLHDDGKYILSRTRFFTQSDNTRLFYNPLCKNVIIIANSPDVSDFDNDDFTVSILFRNSSRSAALRYWIKVYFFSFLFLLTLINCTLVPCSILFTFSQLSIKQNWWT